MAMYRKLLQALYQTTPTYPKHNLPRDVGPPTSRGQGEEGSMSEPVGRDLGKISVIVLSILF